MNDGKRFAIFFNERIVMHLISFTPVLAEFIGNPVGGIFLVLLSVVAVLRGKI
jgi:hypothetical protein